MHISHCLVPERCQISGDATSRKRALQALSEIISAEHPEFNSFRLLKAMTEREQQGSTAIGNGVALPHARIEACEEPIAAVLILDNPVDFNASDEELVDILIALIVPPETAFSDIKGLDILIESFNDKTRRAQIRNSHSTESLLTIIEQGMVSTASEQETQS